MRKVVLGLGISLDGYIARLDDSVDFLFMPKDYSMAPFFETVDAAVMGRKTLDAALKMNGGAFEGGSMENYVFSRTSRPERRGITYVKSSPAEFIAELRKRPGKDIWLMGGGELVREFLRADLVDEYYLGVVPVIFEGGNGLVHLKYGTARITRADGQIITQQFGNTKGSETDLQGTKQTDRVEVWVTMDNGKTYKIIDQLAPYRTRG